MSFIELEERDAVGIIRFNRASGGNAFTTEMYADFAKALITLDKSPLVRAILLTANGVDFCTGNDLNGFLAAGDVTPERLADREQTASTDVVHRLAELRKPLVAAIKGRAIGWGATMLLHCDFIIAEDTTTLFYPFVKLGIVPEAGSSTLLEQIVGRMTARKILFLGEPVSAEDALSFGLITTIAPEGQGEAEALSVTNHLAAKPIESLQATKRLLNRPTEPLSDRITAEFFELAQRIASPEATAIMQAMLAKSSRQRG